MKLLTKQQRNNMKMQKTVIFVKKNLRINMQVTKNYCKVWEQSICNLKRSVPRKIPMAFHNGLIYDQHFIKKELAGESEGKFTCLEENNETYITFSVPIQKEVTRPGKNGKEIAKSIS